jgi:hypothetical protein
VRIPVFICCISEREGKRKMKIQQNLKVLFAAVTVLFATATMLWGQKPAGAHGPKYNVAEEIKIKGTVDEIKVVPGAMEGIHLVLKDGTETTLVHVAPEKFLKEMDSEFVKGDQLEVVGCKIKAEDGSDEFLSRQITKKGNELMLRDKKGAPIWASWNPGKK